MTDILAFKGEYRWLSNFWPCNVTYDELPYPTVENAYQAAKSLKEGYRSVLQTCTPGHAKRMGQQVVLRDDWEEVKDDVMLQLVRQKFKNDEALRKLLLMTDGLIVEGNTWGDEYWGVVFATGYGLNKLGKIIMQVRAELRSGL